MFEVNGQPLAGPAFYYPFETFRSVHLASYEAVPSEFVAARQHAQNSVG